MKFIILNLILVLSFFNSAHAEMNTLFEKIDFILIKKEKPKTPLDIFEAKKSKAPLDIIKEEEELRYLQDSFMAKEYGTGSHGGDPDSIEFALIGRQLHSDITNYGQSIFKGDFDFLQFKEKLDTAEINGYLFNNDSHGQGLRKQKFELHNSFEFKCAINKYQVNIIELDRKFLRPTEVDFLRGDFSKARKKLKWKPLISTNELIDDMIQYEMSR